MLPRVHRCLEKRQAASPIHKRYDPAGKSDPAYRKDGNFVKPRETEFDGKADDIKIRRQIMKLSQSVRKLLN
jgi:hypothetical protein